MLTQEGFSAAVARLSRQGRDDAAVEAKACARGLSKDLWESVSAFANTHGGYLFLGIDEERGFSPSKGFDIDRTLDQFVSGIEGSGGQPGSLENPPQFEVARFEHEGKQILVIEIHEAGAFAKPCFIRARGIASGSYKRIDDKDIRLSQTEIYELRNAFAPSPADRAVVEEAHMGDLDDQLIERLLASMRTSRALRGTRTRDAQLTRLNVTSPDGGVRMGGLLTLGYYPQQFFPKLVIDVAVHPDDAKGRPGMVRFEDRCECEGPIGEMVEDATAAITRNLRRRSIVEGTTRKDVPEIPEEVLREALVNAVVHREYAAHFCGQAISVDVFPNRVEVLSPGGLWGGKTTDNLGDGTSRCRNETLMKLLRVAPGIGGLGVYAEGQGTGISFMMRTMEQQGLPTPVFVAGFDYFKVVFLREDAAAKALPTTSRESGSEKVFAVLKAADEPMGAQDIARTTGMKIGTVRACLKKLVDAGKIRATAAPTDRNRKYTLE